jgi:hypothetical protein
MNFPVSIMRAGCPATPIPNFPDGYSVSANIEPWQPPQAVCYDRSERRGMLPRNAGPPRVRLATVSDKPRPEDNRYAPSD